ncbi:MAG: protein kinase, partial [Byssovorax sp.]
LALTRAAVAVGTPLYMSPEQMVSSRDVDSRTDLWSLGVVLYELVTATRPFEADLPSELYARILHGAPRPISTLLATVPAGLEAVILQCLQKERARRFSNAADLAAALAPFVPERGATLAARVASVLGVATAPVRPTELLDADPPRPPAAPPSSSPIARPHALASKAAPRARRAWLSIAAGIAALAVAATITAVVLLHRPAPISAATSPFASARSAPSAPSAPRQPTADAPPPRDDTKEPAAPGSDTQK